MRSNQNENRQVLLDKLRSERHHMITNTDVLDTEVRSWEFNQLNRHNLTEEEIEFIRKPLSPKRLRSLYGFKYSKPKIFLDHF